MQSPSPEQPTIPPDQALATVWNARGLIADRREDAAILRYASLRLLADIAEDASRRADALARLEWSLRDGERDLAA